MPTTIKKSKFTNPKILIFKKPSFRRYKMGILYHFGLNVLINGWTTYKTVMLVDLSRPRSVPTTRFRSRNDTWSTWKSRVKYGIFLVFGVPYMKIRNFFQNFFSSKMIKNDVLGLLQVSRNENWWRLHPCQQYKLPLTPICVFWLQIHTRYLSWRFTAWSQLADTST